MNPSKISTVIPNEMIGVFSQQNTFTLQDIIDTNTGSCIGKELLFRALDLNGKQVPVRMDGLNCHCSLLFDRLATGNAIVYCMNQYAMLAAEQIHLNVNHSSLTDPEVINNILTLHHGLAYRNIQLVVELLEYTMPTAESIQQAGMLKKHGIKIAIDDFGCGYNIAEYLQGLDKPDYIKLVYDKNLLTLLDGLGLAFKSFNAELNNIIVEFIDSEQKSKSVEAIGLCLQQGFLFH